MCPAFNFLWIDESVTHFRKGTLADKIIVSTPMQGEVELTCDTGTQWFIVHALYPHSR